MNRKNVSLHPDAFGDLDHYATIDRVASFAATEGGKKCVKEILSRPLHCARTLRARAADIHGLAMDRDSIARLRKHLELVAKHEEGAAWCATSPEDLDEDTAEAVQAPYFKGIAKQLNNIWPALWANNCYSAFAVPILAISAPLSYLLAPYFIIRFKLKIPLDFQTFVKLMYHSFKGAGAAMSIAFGKAPSFAMQLASVVMTCVMYFQAVVSSVRHSMKLSAAIQRVATQVNCLNRVLQTCDEIADDYDEPFYRRWCGDGYRCPAKKTGSPETYDETFRPWCTSFSKALMEYSCLDRDNIRARLKQLFTLDAVCAFRAAGAAHALRRVTFLPSAYDAVVIRRGRRLRDGDAANDFASMRGANGIVLTGPNASGKSTLLRIVGCVVLLGQTIGMAPAESCAITPVKYVTTMMGIRDDPAAGRSKFQNELQRAGECIESARSRPGDVGLLLLDEIFGGTDSVQGDVCGSKVLTSMTETTGCLYVLATHQRGLVEHSKNLPGIRRYKMESGYKLVPGVNDTYNASDLFGKAMMS